MKRSILTTGGSIEQIDSNNSCGCVTLIPFCSKTSNGSAHPVIPLRRRWTHSRFPLTSYLGTVAFATSSMTKKKIFGAAPPERHCNPTMTIEWTVTAGVYETRTKMMRTTHACKMEANDLESCLLGKRETHDVDTDPKLN